MADSVLKKSSPCYLETDAHNKPQTGFQRVLADNSYNQFKHLMLPHEVIGDCENVHPYKEDIEELSKDLNTEFVDLFDGEVKKIEDTECVWVETLEQLENLAEVLSKERVFGVDTEQEGFRSLLGFTALIQISTKNNDYLVDTIALHDEMAILRPVFANPRICKVFHGADGSDIYWLQRDFHIYVVNMFDTERASYMLWKEHKSFAYLADRYFKVSKNTALRRRDWRPRPLSTEMVEYARTDSHYLLPIANCLVSELKTKSMDSVVEAIRVSNESCLKLYKKKTKEAYLGETAAASIIYGFLKKNKGMFHYNACDAELRCSCVSKFWRIVRRLCGWREIMARVHDESLGFILSDEAICAISSTLPVTETDIRETICRADGSTSPSNVVCSHFEDFGMLMFPDRAPEDDDLGHTIVQKCLGSNDSNGSCPLSVYNNSLRFDTIPKLSNIPVNPNTNRSNTLCDREKSIKRFSCKSKVYDNIRVIAEDGRPLWYCNRRMKHLYLRRDLAKLVEDDPTTIVYLDKSSLGGVPYEHKSNEIKQNIGLGCGEGNYARYRIIPMCYLKWFPHHLSHCQDIELLCIDCYAIVHVAVSECKQQIAKEFGIPLIEYSKIRVRRAALTLLDGSKLQKMPPSRVKELRKTVSVYYGGKEVTVEDLKQAAFLGLSKRNSQLRKKRLASQHSNGRQVECSKKDMVDDDDDDDDHGKLVVDYILKNKGRDGILEFCQRWRQVLADALQLT